MTSRPRREPGKSSTRSVSRDGSGETDDTLVGVHRVGLVLVLAACSFEHGQRPVGDGGGIDTPPSIDAPIDGPTRTTVGLVALYAFDENGGVAVTDTAGVTGPVDLAISDASKVTWTPGALSVDAPVIIASPKSVPNRISMACKATGAMTLEAWVTPALANQNGASGQFARVVTMSVNAGGRNFAIGQQGTAWAAEAMTANPGTNGQGEPILSAGTVATTPTQLVLTVDATSRQLFIDGQLVAGDALGGNLAGWKDGYRLGFGAEPSLNNPWRGSLSLVAVYDRVLSGDEITRAFTLGPDAR